ncbi:hypothetical protein PBT90_15385 [Algoriphagus halophytocola]|uniref:Outer membrane protein beta-barrel domain-containing protein n=1 Tax=Algoriphagus halophytocola TaxID=2991499 RepID=A0ABY6MCF4_9BACT|nr:MULTISPECIES: hypothetical protein [unclassified Algoriphagus]UZD20959.1 hypothetical protein OM944_09720 [Algoriphagus sp. TR-M5]WBL42125.1 hypothetical protein PBT90_15385 [Algoriphagus sp. TR-M9]
MKKLKFILSSIFLLLGISQVSLAQREDAGNYDYDKEYMFGINKNTNGGLIGGFVFKAGTRLDDTQFSFWAVEFSNVKNPKEVRYNTVLGNSYIFGKSNYLYSIRPQYGREIILFKKAPNQGVQVSALAAIGPSFGLIAPYYIEYALNRVETVREQYDPEVHQSRFNILGTGRLFEGLGESEFAFGGNLKAAISFEFGVFRSNATGLELGYMLEGFTKEIPLIPTTENRQLFQSAYFTFFYGFRQ